MFTEAIHRMACMALGPFHCTAIPAQPQKTSTTSTRNVKLTTLTSSPTLPAKMKKVLVPVGLGTEEMEAVILVDVLRRAGADVLMASVEPEVKIEGSAGTKLVSDTLISSCSDEIFDLVALPIFGFMKMGWVCRV